MSVCLCLSLQESFGVGPSGSPFRVLSLRAAGEGQGGLGVPHGGLCCPALLILPPKESDVIDPCVCTEGPFLLGFRKGPVFRDPCSFGGELSLWSSPAWLGLALTRSPTPQVSAPVGAARPP